MKEELNNLHQYKGFIETEPLFTKENTPFTESLFQNDIESYSGIETLDIKQNLMLGKRAEAYFRFQLNKSNRYTILAENIQIRKHKITIGELDFILKDKISQKKIHVEMAYKFYLYDPNIKGEEINKWIGPNRNDNLVKKITKLKSHQFPLLYSQETLESLNFIELEPIEQQLVFKAKLFIPYHLKDYEFTSVNKKSIYGLHSTFEDFIRKDHETTLFYIPKKQDWLSKPNSNKTWYSLQEILPKIEEAIIKRKSPLVWALKNKTDYESLFLTWW